MDFGALKGERERIKETLRELEQEQRQLDAQQKAIRQREIRAKRTLDALETLISLASDNEEPTPNG